IRNPHPFAWQLGTLYSHRVYNAIFIILMYVVDIISLIKARILIKLILMLQYTVATTLGFVSADLIISYLLPPLLLLLLSFTPIAPLYGVATSYKLQFFLYDLLTLTQLPRF